MYRMLLGLLAGAGLLAAAVTPVSAQWIPGGSYQQSCTNINIRGNRLSARCSNGSGGYNYSSLNISNCNGTDIRNTNGQLTCAGNGYGYGNNGYGYDNNGYGPGHGHGRGHAYGHRHHGRDWDRDRDRDRDDDDDNGNRYGYGNGNGNYNGRYGYNNGSIPGGSYQGSCTNISMNGPMLTASCNNVSGGTSTTTINAARCGGDIANVNGRLECR